MKKGGGAVMRAEQDGTTPQDSAHRSQRKICQATASLTGRSRHGGVSGEPHASRGRTGEGDKTAVTTVRASSSIKGGARTGTDAGEWAESPGGGGLDAEEASRGGG